jgi:hypothetical protein
VESNTSRKTVSFNSIPVSFLVERGDIRNSKVTHFLLTHLSSYPLLPHTTSDPEVCHTSRVSGMVDITTFVLKKLR